LTRGVELLLLRLSSEDLQEAILSWARQLIEKSGLTQPPFHPEALAPLCGVKKILRVGMTGDAILIRSGQNYVIKVNANHSRQRQNFSIAHELAHTFFLHEAPTNPQVFKSSRGIVSPSKCNSLEEELCNLAAAELVMPMRYFLPRALELGLAADSIMPLVRMFDTSVRATLRRLIETSLWRCIMITWDMRDRPGAGRKLRVDWFVKSKGLPYYIPRHKPPPPTSSIYYTYRTGLTTKEVEDLDLGNLRGRYYVESAAFGSVPSRYVVSIVFLDDKMPQRASSHRTSFWETRSST